MSFQSRYSKSRTGARSGTFRTRIFKPVSHRQKDSTRPGETAPGSSRDELDAQKNLRLDLETRYVKNNSVGTGFDLSRLHAQTSSHLPYSQKKCHRNSAEGPLGLLEIDPWDSLVFALETFLKVDILIPITALHESVYGRDEA